MKLLFIQNNADLYGSSRSLLRLTSRLVRDGHAVAAVLPYDGSLREALARAGVQVELQLGLAVVDGRLFRSPLQCVLFLFRYPVSLLRMIMLIHRLKPDIVHTNTSVVLTSGVAATLMRVPHIWHIRENYSEFRAFWRLYQHYIACFSHAIICVSKSIQDQFSPAIRECRTKVINNGFPNEEFVPVGPERIAAFREKFGLGAAPLVGLIGRINIKRKGQNIFVDAVARLGSKFTDVRYLIVGSVFPGNEWHLDALREQMCTLGVQDRFVLTGEVADIKAVYAALNMVLMISELPEAFNGVVVEGMAMGKPVIGTDVGGTAEQIADGETGLLIPPGDAGALAVALDRLLVDRENACRMGAAGRVRFEKQFEFEPFYRKIQDVYRETTAVSCNR